MRVRTVAGAVCNRAATSSRPRSAPYRKINACRCDRGNPDTAARSNRRRSLALTTRSPSRCQATPAPPSTSSHAASVAAARSPPTPRTSRAPRRHSSMTRLRQTRSSHASLTPPFPPRPPPRQPALPSVGGREPPGPAAVQARRRTPVVLPPDARPAHGDGQWFAPPPTKRDRSRSARPVSCEPWAPPAEINDEQPVLFPL